VATYRSSAKVLLLDSLDRVLLLSGIDRTKPAIPPWWFPVGGGIEANESPEEAAIRETFEETGLVISDPGDVVYKRRFDWDFEGIEYDQEEWYFIVRVDHFEPHPAALTEVETATLRGFRWWSIRDLRDTTEKVFPEGLSELLERHLLA
jgi:8-oxo-dGTP pyrophosphatase MutT (NUDIX family)